MPDTCVVNLSGIVEHLEAILSNEKIEDYKNAFNGLQIENTVEIEKISVAVDACESVLSKAVEAGSQLLIVHHGLFLNGSAPLTGSFYRKIALAIRSGLAVYSSHLPLDADPTFGNNALFASTLTPQKCDRFLGIGCSFRDEVSREELLGRVEASVGGRVHVAPGGPKICRRIGIVTGGAGGEIVKAAAEGVDTFITGEGPHWTYTAAEELGINLFYAGHYATETFGVKALGRHLEAQFGIPWDFIDHPTGL